MTSEADSDQSFRERVEEIREERSDGDSAGDGPDPEMSPAKAVAVLFGVLFGIGLMIGALTSGEPFVALLIFAVGVGILAALGDEDGEFLENLDTQQQGAGGGSSDPTRICSECGWQNPRSNSYCHDCGAELGRASDGGE